MLDEVGEETLNAEGRQHLRALRDRLDCVSLESDPEVRALMERVRTPHQNVCCAGLLLQS